MGLEQIIADNTAALRELTVTLRDRVAPVVPQEPPAATSRKGRGTKASQASTAETSAPQDQTSPDSPDRPLHDWHVLAVTLRQELDGAEPTLANLRRAILGISTHIGREQAQAVLARFGAKAVTAKPGVPGLDPGQYPDAFALCLDVLAGRTDATREPGEPAE